MKPGEMMLTRMPLGPSSRAAVLERAFTAAFDAV
jgi:hypothetical protein